MKTDKYQYVVSPVLINYTTYNTTNLIFENKMHPQLIYYSLAVIKVGVNIFNLYINHKS
jgi:hypothetical protein